MAFAFKQLFTKRRLLLGASAAGVLATGSIFLVPQLRTADSFQYQKPIINKHAAIQNESTDDLQDTYTVMLQNVKKKKPKSRQEMLALLDKNEEQNIVNDVLIIGGGATGTACAVDAITRDPNLKVVLLEMNDFSSGTSSKSTKLIHGGVRYLEKAVMQLSKSQLDLVIEALNERAHMISTAPHLCDILPIMIPIYETWRVPYFYIGTKMYDLFSGSTNLKSSYFLTPSKALDAYPMLDSDGLKAAIVYHDGSFNDSRMNVSMATTAIEKNCTVLNYMKVKRLLKNPTTGKVEGCVAENVETGETYKIKSKTVVNATGPYSDAILNMDNDPQGLPLEYPTETINKNENCKISEKIAVFNPKMIIPSAGVHIILPSYYCPTNMGLLDATTADGRVMFFLPWQNKVIAGTTDVALKNVPATPTATEYDIQDILNELQHYVKFPVKREDVLSAWSGIRPLAKDPRIVEDAASKGNTESIVRSHFLFTSNTGLITIAAGKWTTVYAMARETIDQVVTQLYGSASAKPCKTKDLKLSGAEFYSRNLPALLSQEFGIPTELANHLSLNYGTNASVICEMFRKDPDTRLPVEFGTSHKGSKQLSYDSFEYPFTVAELKYAIDYEYARTPLDFLLRRTRFGFLDSKKALQAVEGTVEIMSKELKWSSKEKKKQTQYTVEYLKTFGI